jgi:hypothetical protein
MRGIDWDAVPLGEVSDGEIARQLGCCRATVMRARQQRGIASIPTGRDLTAWDEQPLGQVSDATLARQLGCHEETVRHQRQARAIPPACDTRPKGIDWGAQPLGVEPDYIIARRLGVATNTVNQRKLTGHWKARQAIRTLVRRNKMQPASAYACVDCGVPAAEYDHYLGYHRPVDVQPGCRACHGVRTSKQRRTLEGRR